MGSDSGGDVQTSTTTTGLPDYLRPYAETALQRGVDLSNAPYQAYEGDRLAPLTGQHDAGLSMIENRASTGSPLNTQNQSFLGGMMQGQYGPQMGSNPYMGQTAGQIGNSYLGMNTQQSFNPYIGAMSGGAFNPYIGAQTEVGKNQYAGANPYLEQNIQRSLGDVQGRVNAQFGNSAFGGSANQELLGRELGNTSSAMRMQDYGMQQQLAEADIARRAQYGNADITRNAGLLQQQGQFNVGTRQADLARNSQLAQQQGQFNSGLAQADLSRNSALEQQMNQFNLGASQTDISRNAALAESGLNRDMEGYSTDMQNRLRASALAPQAMNQDYTDAQNMLAAGDIRRQTSQDQLNLQYENWLREQNYPYQQMDVLRNTILGSGGGTSTTTAPNPYQPNTAAGMLGGGLLGAGIGGMLPSDWFGGYGTAAGAAGGALLPWIFGGP